MKLRCLPQSQIHPKDGAPGGGPFEGTHQGAELSGKLGEGSDRGRLEVGTVGEEAAEGLDARGRNVSDGAASLAVVGQRAGAGDLGTRRRRGSGA